ncbi:hypothetical protein YM80_004822 [Salmonella enterica subsp. salamae]|nr:hypothetical protein [Salmonella enterica subsp. salamae]
MQFHKIPGNIRVRQELPERGVWECCFSSSTALALKNVPDMLLQAETLTAFVGPETHFHSVLTDSELINPLGCPAPCLASVGRILPRLLVASGLSAAATPVSGPQ